jgi:hypothetical protein
MIGTRWSDAWAPRGPLVRKGSGMYREGGKYPYLRAADSPIEHRAVALLEQGITGPGDTRMGMGSTYRCFSQVKIG